MALHPLHSDNVKGKTYATGHWVCFDFETTNLDYGSALNPGNRIVCVSWLEKGGAVKSHYGNPLECAEFWQALERADFFIAQNGKFECHWLWRLGYDPTTKLWADPMLFEWVLLGNNPDSLSLSLDAMCKRYGFKRKERFVAALMDGGVCPSQIPYHYLIQRCERDVTTTAQLFEAQLALLQARGQVPCAVTRCLFMPVLSAIERNGIVLDAERVLAEHEEYSAKYAELRQRMSVLTHGIENERSPNAMIPFIYGVFPRVKDGKEWREMTVEEKAGVRSLNFKELTDRRGNPKRGKKSKSWPEGRPLLNKRVMETLQDRATTKAQKDWVQLRKEIGQAFAALSKNLDFFKGVVLEYDCKFYAEIMQGITATHRTSGRGKPLAFELFDGDTKSVQSQNMPREFKSLQTVRDPDYRASDADGKQLEFRFAAFLGQDARAIGDIRNPDFDAHLQTLTVMLNGTYSKKVYVSLLTRYRAGDKEVKKQRADNQLCKGHTYKPLFGGEKGTPTQEAYYKWFRENYNGITEECTRWLQEVERSSISNGGIGELRTQTGLIFRWHVKHKQGYGNKPPMLMNAKTFKPLKPSVFNYPVQHLATGEGIPVAVTHLYYRVVKHGLRAILTNTVHDNVSAEVHKDDKDAWFREVTEAFTTDVYRYFRIAYGINLNVPLGVDISFGSHMGEGESFSVDVENKAA